MASERGRGQTEGSNTFGVPFAILRAISDDLDENKGMDFVKFCRLAADKTVKVLDKFLQIEN